MSLNMKRKPGLKAKRVENGKLVRPPEKGMPYGEWVDTEVQPTEIVEFGWLRSDPMLVRFFERVHRVRMWADGTLELDNVLRRAEDAGGRLDVREETMSNDVRALIFAGGQVVRGLCGAHEAKKAKAAKPRRKSA